MNDHDIMEGCQRAIVADFGDLSDLPPEFANTVANIYYRYFSLLLHSPAQLRPVALTRQPRDAVTGMLDSMTQLGKIQAAHHTIPQMVAQIRKLRDEGHPRWMYDFTVQLALDVFKYDIDNAENKSPARRMIERVLRRPLVRELPDLAWRLGAYRR